MGQTCNVGGHPSLSGSLFGRPKNFGFGDTGGSSEFIAPPAASYAIQRKTDDAPVPIFTEKFNIAVSVQELDSNAIRGGWRSMYALGPMLGDGVSAKVYEAEALSPSSHVAIEGLGAVVWGNCGGKPPCLTERGRRVAIKRFHRPGSRTFKKELHALLRVGVHPHILRLLESYEGCDGEDVLVLEYCDGSTVYDLYAREHPNGGLSERMIARLVRQLLLALEHLAGCGIEHQDVKPENMMLHDVSLANNTAELKLGDFGWAMVVPTTSGGPIYKPPATGAGSLWYAPPELNPPVKGIPHDTTPVLDDAGNPVRGRSDMWSVGVGILVVGRAQSLQCSPQVADTRSY
jgi:serine/threonine protein kinase